MKKRTSHVRREAWCADADVMPANVASVPVQGVSVPGVTLSEDDTRVLFCQLEQLLFPSQNIFVRFFTKGPTRRMINASLQRWNMTTPKTMLWGFIVHYSVNFEMNPLQILAECLAPKLSKTSVVQQQALQTAISQNLPILLEVMHLDIADAAPLLPEVLHKWTEPSRATVQYLSDGFETLMASCTNPVQEIGFLQFFARQVSDNPQFKFEIIQKVIRSPSLLSPDARFNFFRFDLSQDDFEDLLFLPELLPDRVISKTYCGYLSRLTSLDIDQFLERGLRQNALPHMLELTSGTPLAISARVALLSDFSDGPNSYLDFLADPETSVKVMVRERNEFSCQLDVWLDELQTRVQIWPDLQSKALIIHRFFELYSMLTLPIRVVLPKNFETEMAFWRSDSRTISLDHPARENPSTCRPVTLLPPAVCVRPYEGYSRGVIFPRLRGGAVIAAAKRNMYTASLSHLNVPLRRMYDATKREYQALIQKRLTIHPRAPFFKLLEVTLQKMGRWPLKSTTQILKEMFPSHLPLAAANSLEENLDLAKAERYCKDYGVRLEPVFFMMLFKVLVRDKVEALSAAEYSTYGLRASQPKRHLPWISPHNEALCKKMGRENPVPLYVLTDERVIDTSLAHLFVTCSEAVLYNPVTGSSVFVTRDEFRQIMPLCEKKSTSAAKVEELFRRNPSGIPAYLALIDSFFVGNIKAVWHVLSQTFPHLTAMISALPRLQVFHLQQASISSNPTDPDSLVGQIYQLALVYFNCEGRYLSQRILQQDLDTTPKPFLLIQSLHAYAFLLSPLMPSHLAGFCLEILSVQPSSTLVLLATPKQILNYVGCNQVRWLRERATHLQILQDLIRSFSFGNHTDQQLRNFYPAGLWSLHFTGVTLHLDNPLLGDWLMQLVAQKETILGLVERLSERLKAVWAVFATSDLRHAYLDQLASDVVETGVCMEARLAFIEPLMAALSLVPEDEKGWLGLTPLRPPSEDCEVSEKEMFLAQCEMTQDFIVLRCSLIYRVNLLRSEQGLPKIPITDEVWNDNRLYAALKIRWPERGDETPSLFESDSEIATFYNALVEKISSVARLHKRQVASSRGC